MLVPSASSPPGPPVDPERRWLAEVYQPDARQLTVRAVLAGCVLGGVMALSNLYVVLKTGWSLGVTITACILAFAFFRGARAARLARTEFGPLENNAMASVASAAGYMTGGGNMAALPALVMLTGARPDARAARAWFAAIAALGVFVAIPIKRQLINREQLPFPTGTATAETIRALHGARRGGGQARLLGARGAARRGDRAGSRTRPRRGRPVTAPRRRSACPSRSRGLPAGALGARRSRPRSCSSARARSSRFRTGWSMLLGAVLTYGVLAPAMVARGVIAAVTTRPSCSGRSGAAPRVLVTSGLLSFAFQWRSVVRVARRPRARCPRRRRRADPLAAVEAPGSWFPPGSLVLGPLVVLLMWRALRDPALGRRAHASRSRCVLGFIAARVTGRDRHHAHQGASAR